MSIKKLCCVLLLGIIASSLLIGGPIRAEGTPAATQAVTGQKVKIKAPDGLDLVGLYYPVTVSKAPAVLLLHDGVSTKEQWLPYVAAFTQAGYNVVVVEQRGPGETRLGTPAASTPRSGAVHHKPDLPMAPWSRQ